MEEEKTYMEEKRYCRKCGVELKGKEKFCPKCGESILWEELPKVKKRGRKIVIATIGIIGILGIGTAVAYCYLQKQEKKKNHVTAVKEDANKEDKEDFAEVKEENYLAIVTNKDGKNGLINAAGAWVSPCEYKSIYLFSQKAGLIEVINSDEKIGFIDKNGEEIIPCQYENAWSFTENGLAGVEKDGKWGFVNETERRSNPMPI